MGNRFWEFYLVRYLAGTIFGILVIFYLFVNFNTQILNAYIGKSDEQTVKAVITFLFGEKLELNVFSSIVLAVLGFLYMYISSMFILILHAIRSCFSG